MISESVYSVKPVKPREGKYCLQEFANKVALVSRNVTFDWFFSRLSPDVSKICLKKCLFKYPSVSCTFSVPGELQCQIAKHRLAKKQQRSNQGRIDGQTTTTMSIDHNKN